MKVPTTEIRLAGGLICPASEIDRAIWQEHVVKHPLGIGAMAGWKEVRPWNTEGWDRVEPPAITEPERVDLVRAIAALSEGKLRCEVPELRGKRIRSEPGKLACRDCQPPVVVRCDKLLNAPGAVGERYRDVTESLLAELSEGSGVQITRENFNQAFHRLWQTPAKLVGAVVLSVGLVDGRHAFPVARINRYDGVRAEFYFEEPDTLRWRTTFRQFSSTRTALTQFSFLSDVPEPAPGLGRVSEICVVARSWWEAHGI